MYAARDSGSVPCLRALVSGGPGGALDSDCSINAEATGGMTALDLAYMYGHAKFAAVLEELGGR